MSSPDFFDRPVSLPCLKCGVMITKSIRWYRENPGDPCVSCGQPIFIMIEGDIPILNADDPTKPH
jgi:hypothetical protein